MTQLDDFVIPDLRINLSDAPADPVERAQWIRRAHIRVWLRAWNLSHADDLTRKWISELLSFQAQRRRHLRSAREARDRGDVTDTSIFVRRALAQHRVVKRLLRKVRQAAAAVRP